MTSSSLPCPAAAGIGGLPFAWLVVIPLGCLVLGQILLATQGIVAVFDGSLADSDAYMRLARVQHLYESGMWFDSRFPRINPPEGHVQHWTRPLDILLLLGALGLEPLFGFRDALFVWGVLLSPLALALAIVVLFWATAPLLDLRTQLIASLTFLLQPMVMAYSSIGRPDHHSLLTLLFVAVLGCLVRLCSTRPPPRVAPAAGLLVALALWISMEGLVLAALALAVVGLRWLRNEPGALEANRQLAMGLIAGLFVALLIERGPYTLAEIDVDRLSFLHVVAFGLVGLFWQTIGWLERRRGVMGMDSLASRTVAAALGVAICGASLVLLFPELGAGPLGPVDPLYDEVRLRRIVEIRPLIVPELLEAGAYGEILHRAIQLLGIAIVAIPFLAAMLICRPPETRWLWAPIAFALLLFVPLGMHQVRWLYYTQTALVLPYAAAIGALLSRLSPEGDQRGPWVRPTLIVGALFWPVFIIQLLPPIEIETAGGACPLDRLAPEMARLSDGQTKTIMGFADYGSELLWRTPHLVLSMPNHRPQPGFGATWRAFTTSDVATARRELEGFGVDWILLCPSRTERRLFATEERNFYDRLVAGDPPHWLKALPLAPHLGSEARLYEVEPVRDDAGS